MDLSLGRDHQLRYGGLVVALVGFTLSRASVLVVADPSGSLTAFLTTGLVPLVLALSLTVFGISLAVGTFEPWYVNTVTVWTLAGTVGMVLVVGLSVLNPVLSGEMAPLMAQSGALVTNSLVGGAVGGAIIGLHSARNRRQRRTLARQSRQTIILDRILRDEVLNAVTAIRGRTDHLGETGSTDEESLGAIRRSTNRIRDAVDDVGFLASTDGDDRSGQTPVALAPTIRTHVRTAADRAPDASLDLSLDVDDSIEVQANDRLGTVFEQLIETAVERHPAGAPDIDVSVGADETATTVSICDDGRPLSEKQRRILTEDDISEYDDPRITFGYPIISFLLDQHDGEVDVERTDGQTRVTVELPRVHGETTPERQHGVTPTALRNVTVAALAAGTAMGLVLQAFGDTVPVIGSLYGVSSVVVGWTTHLFHSIVFGILFATALSRPFLRNRVSSLSGSVTMAVAYALVLAVGAAGIVMPLWLNAVGVAAPVPLLLPVGVLGHLVWGVVLSAVYWLLS